jgi:hypothetical protein
LIAVATGTAVLVLVAVAAGTVDVTVAVIAAAATVLVAVAGAEVFGALGVAVAACKAADTGLKPNTAIRQTATNNTKIVRIRLVPMIHRSIFISSEIQPISNSNASIG